MNDNMDGLKETVRAMSAFLYKGAHVVLMDVHYRKGDIYEFVEPTGAKNQIEAYGTHAAILKFFEKFNIVDDYVIINDKMYNCEWMVYYSKVNECFIINGKTCKIR